MIPRGELFGVGMVYSVNVFVVGLNLPILFAADSVNQRLPSDPTAMLVGCEEGVGTVTVLTTWSGSDGLMLPILLAPVSVNQRRPPGPETIPLGFEPGLTGNSKIIPLFG